MHLRERCVTQQAALPCLAVVQVRNHELGDIARVVVSATAGATLYEGGSPE